MSLEQLTYSGVFEAVQIRKQGFPFRWTYPAFATRYRCINPNHKYVNKVKGPDDVEGAKALCKEILDTSPQDFKEVQFGVSMLLYRAKEHKLLKLLRNLALETIIPRLQKYMRGFLPREMKRRLLKGEKAIREAMERKNDYPGLKQALEQAEPTVGNLRRLFPGYKARNISAGEAYLAELKKWVDMEKQLNDMFEKDPNKVYKDFRALLGSTDAIKHIPQTQAQIDLVEKCISKCDNCAVGLIDAESQKLMVQPKTEHKRDILQRLSNDAKKYDFTSPSIDLVNEDLAEYSRIDNEAAEALSTISRERMIQVMKDASVFDYLPPNHEKIKSILDKFDRIDNDCREALEEMNKEKLQAVLNSAREINHTSDYVKKVEHSIAEFDRVVVEAKAAIEVMNPPRLIKVLADAKAIKFSPEIIQEVAKIVVQYEKLDNEARIATDNVSRKDLERIVNEANSLNHESEAITGCKNLLSLSEKQFVETELSAAEAKNDKARIIHRKIRLLQINLDEEGSKYENFKTFSELKTPEEYASSKMLGKAKLRETFYIYDAGSAIPTSLTKSNDAAFKKQAVTLNKLLRAWTGDGKESKGPEESAASFLSQAANGSDNIRNEVYCQLVKHLTNNNNPTSSEKGWILLGLTCRYVTPTPAIEKFIMMFIKKKSPPYGGKWFSAMNECRYGKSNPPNSGSGIQQAVDDFSKLEETGSRFSFRESKAN